MLFDDKKLDTILLSLEGEVAKALSELRCAQNDLKQSESRLKFILATVHYLKTRLIDKEI